MTHINHYDLNTGRVEEVFRTPNDHSYEADHLAEKLQAEAHHADEVYYVVEDDYGTDVRTGD